MEVWRVWGLGFEVQGSGFGVWGLGVGAPFAGILSPVFRQLWWPLDSIATGR